jgi:uncharacterized protein YndB with AHSA1/START domain
VAVTPSETDLVERKLRIEARPETVFSFFTEPEKMVRWMGVGAMLDPRPGGVFRLNVMADYFMAGEFVEVEPYSRVVFTWGYAEAPDGGENPLPPGSTTVEVDFVPDGEATIVRLTHRVPVDLHDFHVMGWDNYLPRLAIVAAGGDPGPDPMAAVVDELEGQR